MLSWRDIEEIALSLDETHPAVDPRSVRFTDLKALVEGLDDFAAEPGQRPNENILEAIQQAWIDERGPAPGNDDDEPGPSYSPVNPFR
jgi:FeS assembly protein IscX